MITETGDFSILILLYYKKQLQNYTYLHVILLNLIAQTVLLWNNTFIFLNESKYFYYANRLSQYSSYISHLKQSQRVP